MSSLLVRLLVPVLALILGISGCQRAQSREGDPPEVALVPIDVFFSLFHPEPVLFETSAETVFANWKTAYAPFLLEVARHGTRTDEILRRLEEVSGERFDGDFHTAYRWLWRQRFEPHPDYAEWKASLYEKIDPRFGVHFRQAGEQPKIRLDEVQWGGVRRDGIPPLEYPKHLPASEASYLEDDHIVFGVFEEGEARAYPKRILAWHELLRDRIGSLEITGVYCTLCGAMIVYESRVAGQLYHLGTSGFLYRSNKLMYDHATESLWSTFSGTPVVGPLAETDLRLVPRSVVTTTWGEWRRRHPATRVLDVETGHRRDYAEGAAYSEYFATDELMFGVPHADARLRNKDEVLALRFGDSDAVASAIDVQSLAPGSIFSGEHGGVDYVVFTGRSGAHRVYETGGLAFTSFDGDRVALDAAGNRWELFEDRLLGANEASRPRLPAHRAFWFGWRAAHPETRLIRATAASAELSEPLL